MYRLCPGFLDTAFVGSQFHFEGARVELRMLRSYSGCLGCIQGFIEYLLYSLISLPQPMPRKVTFRCYQLSQGQTDAAGNPLPLFQLDVFE